MLVIRSDTVKTQLGDLRDTRVLVIGGAGFVGSHVVDLLVRSEAREIVVLDNFVRGSRTNLQEAATDNRVTVIEASITDRTALLAAMNGIDYVFHLAALWLYESVRDPRAAVDVNVIGTLNVAEAAQRSGVKKVIFSSSASVYGDALFTPMTEEHPFNNRTMYGATKIAGEQFFRAFYEQHHLDYLGLRYMNIYGPRMDYRGPYVSVIMKVLDRLDRSLPPIIFGDGSQTYDFVHVEDIARANVLALAAEATDDCLNIGAGAKTTILELVELLLEITGSPLRPEFQPDEHGFVTHRFGSTTRAAQLIGFRATIPLEEGLRRVIRWRREGGDGPEPRATTSLA